MVLRMRYAVCCMSMGYVLRMRYVVCGSDIARMLGQEGREREEEDESKVPEEGEREEGAAAGYAMR
eukprot:1581041-Rhodomonas_salina.1